METDYSQFNTIPYGRFNQIITATLCNFSSNNESGKWVLGKSIKAGKPGFVVHEPLFYANGDCKGNQGYVSVIFHLNALWSKFLFSEIQMSCTMAVVDVDGDKRFMQSLSYAHDMKTIDPNRAEIGLHRYLKRETLLNDPVKLLPGDCLTICMEIDYAFRDTVEYLNLLSNQPLYLEECGRLYIGLDTAFGRELCRLSDVFRRASDNGMIESRTRKMHIPNEDVFAFNLIFNIIFKLHEEWWTISIAYIYGVYIVADKYNIQSVIEVCRQIIKSLLSTTDDPEVMEHADESVDKILKLAHKYRDSDLKDIVETYLESRKNFGTNDYTPGKQLNEWKCEFRYIGNRYTPLNISVLWMTRIAKPEFDFYH